MILLRRFVLAFGGAPSPPPIPVLPPAALPPTFANSGVAGSGVTARASAAALDGSGFAGTIMNSGGAQGPAPALTSTAGKTLLG